MHGILIFGLGAIAGATIGIFIMALRYTSKKADFEHEKLMSYSDGYKKGYDDGYALQKKHFK